MPDPSGALTPAEITAQLQGFMGTEPGLSPLSQAGLAAFQRQQLPLLQQQFELQGLGRSPALGVATAAGLSNAMVPFIQNDLANRMQAIQYAGQYGLGQRAQTLAETMQPAQLGLGQRAQTLAETMQPGQLALGQRAQTLAEFMQPAQLGQSAAGLAAQIGQNEANRQLQALGLQGQLAMGMTDPLARAAALQQQQQQLALQSFGAAGTAQRDTQQQLIDEQNRDFLRRQGLAEQGTLGAFGTVLPPSVQTGGTTKSTTSGGK